VAISYQSKRKREASLPLLLLLKAES